MSVYFIRAEGSGLVKIGFAVSPRLRFNKLKTDCPWPVVIAAIEDGGVEREREIHTRFAEYRSRGEWFCEEGRLAEYIVGLGCIEWPRKKAAKSEMESHGQLIARVGIRKLATLLGHKNHTTVQGWQERSSIPMDHWPAVVQATEGTETPITVRDLMPPELKDAAA